MDQDKGNLDALTGLVRRNVFIQELVETFEECDGDNLGLILLDLRGFSKLNDALGPLIGDALLKRFAKRLRGALVDASTIARISGDGFALLLDDTSALDEVVAHLNEFCSRPFLISGNVINVSAHIGVAQSAPYLEDGYELLHAADIALHVCRDRRQDFVHFAPGLKAGAARDYLIERDLRATLAEGNGELQAGAASNSFSMVYQPKVDTRTETLKGFEALLRWKMADGTQVSPAEFIPIAERTGLIDVIGIWVLRTCCMSLAAWPEDVSLAINVSPRQLYNPDWLLKNLQDVLDETGIEPSRLEIEITESALQSDISEALQKFRDTGVKLMIDDFGTDHSSLARLCSLPFTGLKVDKSVADELSPDGASNAQRLLRALRSIATELRLDTVVEGIEEEWQVDIIRETGIDQIQGFFYGEPQKFSKATKLIQNWPTISERKQNVG